MRYQDTVFGHLLKVLPRRRFEQLVGRLGSDYRIRRLSSWDQFIALLYGQLSGAQSLREIEAGLESQSRSLYHLGAKPTRRSTLSDANASRSAALFEAVFEAVLTTLHPRHARGAGDLVRLVDATLIKLNLTLCSWARFSTRFGTAGLKLHLVYDPRAEHPVFFAITPSRVNDITMAKSVLPIEPGATYVFDKAYMDFAWWAKLDRSHCRFITRRKTNSPYRCLKTLKTSAPHILKDRIVEMSKRLSRNRQNPYAKPVRLIDVEISTGQKLTLLTNDLTAPATEIANLYKERWQIELFFKWIKQNLRIKRFLGTSENAVKIQIIVALIAYLLIQHIRLAATAKQSLQRCAQLIRLNLMHRRTKIDTIFKPPDIKQNPTETQLNLKIL